MLNRIQWVLAGFLGCSAVQATDVLQLKDKAAVAGKILAEKPDQVVVDLGYTVITVPRSEIISIGVAEADATNDSKADAPKILRLKIPVDPSNKSSDTRVGERPGLYVDGARGAQERSVRELVSALGEGVVQVRTPSGLGSGFVINPEGYLITNFHVIESETQIAVEVFHQKDGVLSRRTYKQVRIVAMNKFADLTLLKIEDSDAPKFASIPLGDSDELGVGERVFAIGSPLGLERTVTEGIVSTKTRPMQGELYLQTTTQINPGNSGGPLFNLRGEVVGVTNMKIAFGEGLGFAIPVQTVKFFLNHRDAYAYDNDNPSSPYRYLEPPNRVSKLTPAQ